MRLTKQLEAALADATLEAVAPHPVAIELRHRSWVKGDRLERTLGWLEDHGAIWVGVDAPTGRSLTIMPPVDAVTYPDVAYLRAHGRNAKGYVRGRSVAERFGYRCEKAELEQIGARAHERPGPPRRCGCTSTATAGPTPRSPRSTCASCWGRRAPLASAA